MVFFLSLEILKVLTSITKESDQLDQTLWKPFLLERYIYFIWKWQCYIR